MTLWLERNYKRKLYTMAQEQDITIADLQVNLAESSR